MKLAGASITLGSWLGGDDSSRGFLQSLPVTNILPMTEGIFLTSIIFLSTRIIPLPRHG